MSERNPTSPNDEFQTNQVDAEALATQGSEAIARHTDAWTRANPNDILDHIEDEDVLVNAMLDDLSGLKKDARQDKDVKKAEKYNQLSNRLENFVYNREVYVEQYGTTPDHWSVLESIDSHAELTPSEKAAYKHAVGVLERETEMFDFIAQYTSPEIAMEEAPQAPEAQKPRLSLEEIQRLKEQVASTNVSDKKAADGTVQEAVEEARKQVSQVEKEKNLTELEKIFQAGFATSSAHVEIPGGISVFRRGEKALSREGFQDFGQIDKNYTVSSLDVGSYNEVVVFEPSVQTVYEDREVKTGLFKKKSTERFPVGTTPNKVKNPLTGQDEDAVIVRYTYPQQSHGSEVQDKYPVHDGLSRYHFLQHLVSSPW